MTTTELSPFTRRRRLTFAELLGELESQRTRMTDRVVHAHQIEATPDGYLKVAGIGEPLLTPAGVTAVDGLFAMARTFDVGVAAKLGIAASYLNTMRNEDELLLLATNINRWLQKRPNKQFLVRCFLGPHGEPGVARALLSDSYAFRDNYPVLLAVLAGIKDSGAGVEITGELTDRMMHVKITAPEVTANAAPILRNYRSPFSGQSGQDCPVVSAGIRLTNSELGFGATTITPELNVQVCSNGWVISKDADRTIHAGTKLKNGAVIYSDDTVRKEMDATASKTRDLVVKFLDVRYMVAQLNEIAAEAAAEVVDPNATIKYVGQSVGYTKEQQTRILTHFIKGADTTAGGILHAVTSAAQTMPNADDAWDMERSGLAALAAAARFQR
ncbi:MAG TPA: DUF932 domain-containing protein [Pseudonocardiaceae bacterium]|jgi:uncharacterized glyoxalase superfamily protein PhnB